MVACRPCPSQMPSTHLNCSCMNQSLLVKRHGSSCPLPPLRLHSSLLSHPCISSCVPGAKAQFSKGIHTYQTFLQTLFFAYCKSYINTSPINHRDIPVHSWAVTESVVADSSSNMSLPKGPLPLSVLLSAACQYLSPPSTSSLKSINWFSSVEVPTFLSPSGN